MKTMITRSKFTIIVYLTYVGLLSQSMLLNAQGGSGPDFPAMRALTLKNQLTVPPSPEAASLGKFGEVQISHYTGALNYSIPLPSIGDDKLGWNFALRYDGSGNKPDQIHGQVGQGWTLEGIGVITRIVIGNPDMDINYYNVNKAWLNNPVTYTDLIHENKFLDSLARGYIETHPDLYHYNFAGYSGKFYIKPDKTIFVEDDANLSISATFQSGGYPLVNGDVLTITIRDASGYLYKFEYTERTYFLMEPIPTYSPVYYNFEYNSAWYLKEVLHPNGTAVAKISFTYDQITTDYTPLINPYQYESMTYSYGPTVCSDPHLCGNPSVASYNYATYSSTRISNRKVLKDASFYKGSNLVEKISFINSANTCTGHYGNKKLDRIELKRGPASSTKLTYKAVLTYDCSINRLTLKSLQETNGTAIKEPYTFTYNSTTLPAPGTKDQDFWGYYNSNGGTGMVPDYYQNCSPTPTFNGNGNRNPSVTRMKAGILTKITYPTKGYTEIDYEAHSVAPWLGCQSGNQTVGGLRVKEIRNYHKTSIQAYKIQYKYTTTLTGSTSSGLLIHGLNTAVSGTNVHYGMSCVAPCCETSSTYTCDNTTLISSPIQIPGAVDGYHVGYSRVMEINNGKMVYFFRNLSSSNSMSHSNGDMTKKEIYDESDNLLEKTDYTYWADEQTGSLPTLYSLKAEAKSTQDNKSLLCKTGSIYEWRLQCCAAGAGPGGCSETATFESKLERRYTSIKLRKKYVTKEVQTFNSIPYTATQTSLVRQTIYKYDDPYHYQPTEVKILDGTGAEWSKTIYRYPTVPGTGVPAGMVLLRMFSDPVEVQYFIKGVHVYSTKKDFNTVMPFIPMIFYEKFGAGSYTTKETVNSYDSYSNYKGSTKQYDVPSSYIWSGDGARITAIASNADASEIAFTGFDDSWTYQGGWTNVINTHVKYGTNAGASGNGYYNPNASTSITSPSLAVGKYILSYYSKGAAAITPSTVNATILRTTISPALLNGWKYTEHIIQKTAAGTYQLSLASSAMIDEVRLYLADAQMQSISYDRDTYLPQCISDISGKLNRFEYDDLSRLLVMRNANDEFVQTHQYYHQGGGNSYNGIISRIMQTAGITTTSAAYALTGANVQRTIQYFDGLGRNDQSVGIDLSPTSLDVVSYNSYDTYGRQPKSYLDYSISGTGTTLNNSYRASASTEQVAFYNGLYSGQGSHALAENILEISPLNRSKGIKNPGQSWQTTPTAVSYQFNTASEVRNPEVASAYFGANSLFKIIRTDEDGKLVTQFTDILGRKVMEDAGGLRTYFIYDGFGNIVQVIQPEGCKLLHTTPSNTKSTTSVQNQSFLYTYDNRFRLSTKKIPGTGGVYTFYYDSLDRQVLSIDPKAFKSFTKYDILSRPVLTGKYTGTGTPTGSEGLYENKSTTGHYYTTNLSFPTASVQVYTVHYYDDYDFDVNYSDNASYTLPSAQGTYYPTAAYPAVRGMETGSKSGVLNTAGTAPTVFVTGYTWYDLLGRPVHTNATHPYAGTDLSWSQYHFSGWVLRTRRQHTATIGTSHSYTVNERLTYDHIGRLLKTYHQIADGGMEYEISSNSYNEKDELSKKKLANSQDVDYDYNIRGWLQKINDPASCTSTDLFSIGLHYNAENIDLSASILKNGNISWIEWRTGANCQVGGVTRNKGGYGFTYDGTNRLTVAKYGEYDSNNNWISANVDRYTVDNLTYDENGNIKTLRRKGNTSGSNYGLIDDIAYTYNSTIPNRLSTIAETSLITKGFKKISAGATGYTYDLNGNVNADGYRGITGTTNNHLNLPAKITYSATRYIHCPP